MESLAFAPTVGPNFKNDHKRKMKETGNSFCVQENMRSAPLLDVISVSDRDESDSSSKKSKLEKPRPFFDGRRNNKGATQRKAYSLDIKKRAIALRDSGILITDIARLLNTAKSNVEKWCSAKVINHLKTCFLFYFIFLKYTLTF